MKIYFGIDEIEGGWDRYMDRFSLLEVPEIRNPATMETLNRWRVESPRGFAFVLHATQAFSDELSAIIDRGNGAITDTLRREWKEISARADALAAKAVLIETDASFTPSTRSRELMKAVADELGSSLKARIIWSAFGLWEVDSTREFAESIGLAYAFDPFMLHQEGGSFTHGDACFIVQERAGSRRFFDQFDFEQLVDWCDPYDRVFVLLRGRYKSKHARELGDVISRMG